MRVLWFIFSLQDKELAQHRVPEGRVPLLPESAAPGRLLPLQCTRGQLHPHFQASCSCMKVTTSSQPMWDSGTNPRNLSPERLVQRYTLSDQSPESPQSNLLPAFSEEQRALKLSQPSHPAQAVQCFPARLFPGRQLRPRSPRCSALMGSGCPDPT